jgi:hypothetical protein
LTDLRREARDAGAPAREKGDLYTLLKVLRHDEVYTWAKRSNASVNAAPGGIEIRDEDAVDSTLPELTPVVPLMSTFQNN